MSSLFFLVWLFSQFTSGLFLLNGIAGWEQMVEFILIHGLTVLLTHTISLGILGMRRDFRKHLLTRGFVIFLFVLSAIPFVGPIAMMGVVLFLRFYNITPIQVELYEVVDPDMMWIIQKEVEEATVPVIESLLTTGLSQEHSLKLVMFLDNIQWTPAKTQILRYLIRYSQHPNVSYMAIDIINKKLDSILAEITQIENRHLSDPESLRRLASYYHEICYLDLCELSMKPFYMNKACQASKAAYDKDNCEENGLLVFKYTLEASKIEEARQLIDKIKKTNHNTLKWLSYEIELAVKTIDREQFELLSNVVEYGGGVFIQQNIKDAVTTWRKALTSAWL